MLYGNGVAIGSGSLGAPVPDQSWSSSVALAPAAGSSGLVSAIHDLKLWNGARSVAEVVGDMTLTPSGTDPGLVAWYSFAANQQQPLILVEQDTFTTSTEGWQLAGGGTPPLVAQANGSPDWSGFLGPFAAQSNPTSQTHGQADQMAGAEQGVLATLFAVAGVGQVAQQRAADRARDRAGSGVVADRLARIGIDGGAGAEGRGPKQDGGQGRFLQHFDVSGKSVAALTRRRRAGSACAFHNTPRPV